MGTTRVRLIAEGCQVEVLLFETFGGFSQPVVNLLKRAAAEGDNRLTATQYDETTWSARTWMSFAAQQISVAAHRAAMWELAQAVGVPGVCGSLDSGESSGSEAA